MVVSHTAIFILHANVDFRVFFSSPCRPHVIGPALPPGFKRQDEDEEKEDTRGFLGPALPPGYSPSVSSGEEEEDDDYVVGPMPSKGPSQDSVALDFERRAQRMKDKLTGVDVSAFYLFFRIY